MREESQLERKGLLLGAAPILERGFRVRFAILSAALVMSCAAAAQKPDLHAGGAQPSLLENHKTTKVVLPGYHLAGATLTVDGACSLVTYTASESQIGIPVSSNGHILGL